MIAHEGKMQHRLANLAKIKVSQVGNNNVSHYLDSSIQAELSVDTFLSPDDPRVMAEGR